MATTNSTDDQVADIRPRRNESIFFAIVSVGLFVVFALQLYYHAVSTSATVDEPDHILAGYRHLQCGDFGINPEHPPLLKLIAAVPLAFRDLSDPPWECGSKLTSKFDAFSYGSTFLVENGIDSIVIPTRLAASVMSLLLALLVYLAAWEMFGRWEALTALAIVAFEPSLIAHGSLVTTDVAISATAFGSIFALYRFGKSRTPLRFSVATLAFGLMLASKHSAAVFVGIMFVLLIADTIFFHRSESQNRHRLVRSAAAFAGMVAIALAILWSFYGFRYHAIPSATEPSVSVADYIRENGRPEAVRSIPARITEAVSYTHMLPESYVLGMADVVAWSTRNSWIFGQAYSTGKWFYFPLAFSVKSSLALLVLLPIGLAFLFFTREKWREGMFLVLPATVFFLFALSSNFHTGVRHILPIYAPLIVLASAGAIWLCRKFTAFRYVLAALLVFNAIATVRAAPNYLVYANDIWGGYENTHRIFVDSNTDTGQSMNLVRDHLAREGVEDCWIAVFVHPEMIRNVQPCRPMPSGVRIMVSRDLIDAVPPVIEGTVVLSVMEVPPRGADEYLPISKTEPIAFLGGNTYVYRGRFEVPLAAAISHVHRSGHFLRVKDLENAVAEGRSAVGLGPDDPRTHLALGVALVRAGQVDEAKQELETAARLGKADPRFRNAEVRAEQELGRLK